jgi:hypothetical protein
VGRPILGCGGTTTSTDISFEVDENTIKSLWWKKVNFQSSHASLRITTLDAPPRDHPLFTILLLLLSLLSNLDTSATMATTQTL